MTDVGLFTLPPAHAESQEWDRTPFEQKQGKRPNGATRLDRWQGVFRAA